MDAVGSDGTAPDARGTLVHPSSPGGVQSLGVCTAESDRVMRNSDRTEPCEREGAWLVVFPPRDSVLVRRDRRWHRRQTPVVAWSRLKGGCKPRAHPHVYLTFSQNLRFTFGKCGFLRLRDQRATHPQDAVVSPQRGLQRAREARAVTDGGSRRGADGHGAAGAAGRGRSACPWAQRVWTQTQEATGGDRRDQKPLPRGRKGAGGHAVTSALLLAPLEKLRE